MKSIRTWRALDRLLNTGLKETVRYGDMILTPASDRIEVAHERSGAVGYLIKKEAGWVSFFDFGTEAVSIPTNHPSNLVWAFCH